ncbi:protein phosphatase 1 regulatory subunit 21 [Tachysurus ichikawai]
MPAVVELLYWRDLKNSGIVFGASLLLLLSLSVCSIISVLSYVALAFLSVTISFRIYKGVLQAIQKSDEGHPFKLYLEQEVSLPEDVVRKYSDVVLGRVNTAINELRRLFLVEDLVDSLKFAVLMWILTYVGALFNGLTLLILGLVAMFTCPVVYEKHQAQIDHYVALVRNQVKDVVGNQKVTLEQELPNITQKLRTTNECLLSSLASLTNNTNKIATFFNNNLDFFTSSAGYGPRGGNGSLNPQQAHSMLSNKKHACQYILALRRPRPESVPYAEALSNRRILTSSTESREGLMQQVQQSQEKIARLEQEKEHWLLEVQLGRVRLEKENQRIAELEARLSLALGDGIAAHAVSVATGPAEPEKEEKTDRETSQSSSLVGILTTTPTNESVGDEESREHLIKTHYMARVAELTTQLQMSDSKAVHFHAECRALVKRLAIAEKSREALTEGMKQANQNITSLQDELSTTKRSYEDQLSMMSDHLCSMNETLSKQREEIDTLKLGNKGNSKKNKGR